MEGNMKLTLKLKDPKHGITENAWTLVCQSFKPGSDRKGWTKEHIENELAKGSISISFPNEEEYNSYIENFARKKGLDIFNMV
jgi:hypothetical protein